jgi:hypothetical protein
MSSAPSGKRRRTDGPPAGTTGAADTVHGDDVGEGEGRVAWREMLKTLNGTGLGFGSILHSRELMVPTIAGVEASIRVLQWHISWMSPSHIIAASFTTFNTERYAL